MKELVYAVDPGKKASAVAAFLKGQFIGAWMVSPATINIEEENRGAVVMESPRAYPGTKVRINDLLDLSTAGMEVASKLSRPLAQVRMITPVQWKGQVPKSIVMDRIANFLAGDEANRLVACLNDVPKNLRHNIWDAVGLGLYALGRRNRGMT